MFKLPKRCEYCAHKLVDGKCVNPACIAYTAPADSSKDAESKEGSESK